MSELAPTYDDHGAADEATVQALCAKLRATSGYFGKCCEHGQLARQCESCALEQVLSELAAREKRIAELEAALAKLLTCSATTHACGQCATEAQAALDTERKRKVQK
jgi:hypothetical protein